MYVSYIDLVSGICVMLLLSLIYRIKSLILVRLHSFIRVRKGKREAGPRIW